MLLHGLIASASQYILKQIKSYGPSLYSAGEEGDGLPVTLLEAFLREECKAGKLTTM